MTAVKIFLATSVALFAIGSASAREVLKWNENPVLAHKAVGGVLGQGYKIKEADCRSYVLPKGTALSTLQYDSQCLVIASNGKALICGIIDLFKENGQITNGQAARCVQVQRYLNKLPKQDVAG